MRMRLPYLVVSLEPGGLVLMSVSIVAIPRLPAGGHQALPLRRRAAVGPGSSGGVTSSGCRVRPLLRGAHHPQVLAVFAVIHPPTVVFAVFQRLLCAVAAYVIHPYWALCENKHVLLHSVRADRLDATDQVLNT